MEEFERLQRFDKEALRQMNPKALNELSSELRQFLIERVSANGGHLASNLGVVELSIALHRSFDTPQDKIIWDVGHQSYVHKILTGRGKDFVNLRQYGGLSGFPKREESEHDVFDTGHSSTSLSAAIGVACAQESLGKSGKVVAVIGDGALTGGMAYEAINQIGSEKKPIIMILNDNNMSISSNVGALHYQLSRFRSGEGYLSFKRKLAKNAPRLTRVLEKVKNSFKYLFVSSAFFEELGIKYIGPIDGHDIAAMDKIFERVKRFEAPVLVHILTTKGKGYEPAESQPERFHGVPAARKVNNDKARNEKPLPAVGNSQVFSRELCTLAEEDKRIVAITAAMAEGTGLQLFQDRFPDRFYDVGIAEQHATTFAAGLAVGGMRPVLSLYSSFLQRAYDQMLHDVCLQNLPVVVGVDRCGPVGEDGETHQGIYDISYLMPMPNLTLFSPSNQADLKRMLRFALAEKGPVAIRFPRQRLPLGVEKPAGEDIRRWKRLNDWTPLVIVATGQMVEIARQTADLLRESGIGSTIVDARCLKPMDENMLAEIAAQARWLVTLEDGIAAGGLGEHILATLAERDMLPAWAIGFAMPEKPLPHGDMGSLFAHAELTPPQLHTKIRGWIEGSHARKKQA